MKRAALLVDYYQEKHIYSPKAIKSQLLQVNENPAAGAGIVDVGKMDETQVEAQGKHRGEKNMKAAAQHGIEAIFAETEVELFEFTADSQKRIRRESAEFGPEFDSRAQAVQSRFTDPVTFEFQLDHGSDGPETGREAIAEAGRLVDGTGDQSGIQGRGIQGQEQAAAQENNFLNHWICWLFEKAASRNNQFPPPASYC